MPTSQFTQFSPPLHGIRGMAVLYVVLSHMGNSGLFILPIQHNAIGKVGVWIFFVLSAFLLTSRLHAALQKERNPAHVLVAYFIQRMFRIYPLFVFALVLHLLLSRLSGIDVIDHLLLLKGVDELWAIPVEFKYYFVIPVVALTAQFLRLRTVVWILATGIVASLASGIMFPPDVFSNSLSLLPKLAPFLVGSMTALLMIGDIPSRWQLQSKFSTVQFLPVIAVAISTLLYKYAAASWSATAASPMSAWIGVIMAFSFASLIYASLRWQLLFAFFGSRFMVFMGEVSFSLYLLHMFVIRFILEHQVPVRTSLKPLTCLILAIFCAYMTYRLIERPGVRLGKLASMRLLARLNMTSLAEASNTTKKTTDSEAVVVPIP